MDNQNIRGFRIIRKTIEEHVIKSSEHTMYDYHYITCVVIAPQTVINGIYVRPYQRPYKISFPLD
jgi:hypothetical protein